jgi:D-glycero-D-manno-heptose 1,7-bisphosphate phosphatase
MRPAVFLDRDGTLLHDPGYLSRLEDVRWFPWSLEAIRLLNRGGFLVFVITNQGGIALGLFDEAFVTSVHDRLRADLAAAGAHVDGWYYCPHHPRGEIAALRIECECRKPRPGMIHQAQREFDIDLEQSFAVGDKATDVALATGVGARGVLVLTGHGEAERARGGGTVTGAACVAANLMDATSWMLAEHARRPPEAS